MSKYDSVTPVLRDVLHWLPIKERINFKIEVLTYKALNGLASSYLSEMLMPVAVNPALSRNRSVDCGDLTVPRAKNTSYSDRSFAIAAPMLWNSFPVELRCSSSMTIFCKRLNPFDAGRQYTSFAQTSKRRQKPVYRVCANFPTSPETGIPGLRKLSNSARPRYTGFIF